MDIDFVLDKRSRELFNQEYRRYTLLRTGKWLEGTKAHNFFVGRESVKEILYFLYRNLS